VVNSHTKRHKLEKGVTTLGVGNSRTRKNDDVYVRFDVFGFLRTEKCGICQRQ